MKLAALRYSPEIAEAFQPTETERPATKKSEADFEDFAERNPMMMVTTTVTAAFGFYVLDIHAGTANNVIVYQDTDGDSIIEAGEFAVQLAGAAQFTTGEFTISTGDLLFTSA